MSLQAAAVIEVVLPAQALRLSGDTATKKGRKALVGIHTSGNHAECWQPGLQVGNNGLCKLCGAGVAAQITRDCLALGDGLAYRITDLMGLILHTQMLEHLNGG